MRVAGRIPWTITEIGRSVAGSSAINTQQYRRRWQRDRSRSRLQLEERDVWTTLFIFALAAAISFGVAAIVLPRIKYLARLGG
jgi:hypothetical protein